MYVLLSGGPPFSEVPHPLSLPLINGCHGTRIDFPAAAWEEVSLDAKDLLRRMLEVDPRRRRSAVEVCRSAWFRDGDERDSSSLRESSVCSSQSSGRRDSSEPSPRSSLKNSPRISRLSASNFEDFCRYHDNRKRARNASLEARASLGDSPIAFKHSRREIAPGGGSPAAASEDSPMPSGASPMAIGAAPMALGASPLAPQGLAFGGTTATAIAAAPGPPFIPEGTSEAHVAVSAVKFVVKPKQRTPSAALTIAEEQSADAAAAAAHRAQAAAAVELS